MSITENTDLAAAAGEALDADPATEQGLLPGTNLAQVRFVGMAWEGVDRPELRSEVSFRVEGMVVGHGEDVMADGSIRQFAKVKVQSVVMGD